MTTATPAPTDLRTGEGRAARLARILDRSDELLHREPRRAERLARWCDARADETELLAARARARYQRAQIAAERGELDQALELISQARTCWSGSGDRVAAMRTDLGRMHVLDDLGRHQEALELGERLIREVDGLDGATSEDELPG